MTLTVHISPPLQ